MAPDKPKPHPLLEQPLLSPRPPTFASIPRINPPPQCQVHLPALHLTPEPLHMCLDTSAGAKQQETTWKQGAPRMLVTPKTCSWECRPLRMIGAAGTAQMSTGAICFKGLWIHPTGKRSHVVTAVWIPATSLGQCTRRHGKDSGTTTGHQSSKGDVGGILGSLDAENSLASSPDLCCH